MSENYIGGRVEIFFGPGYRQEEEYEMDTRRAIAKASNECHIPMGPDTNHPNSNPGHCEALFGCDYAYYEFLGGEEGIDPRALEFVEALNTNHGICAKLIEITPEDSKRTTEKRKAMLKIY